MEFKIEFEPQNYSFKYVVYKKYYKWFGFSYDWEKQSDHETFEKAEEALKEHKKFPKFYEY